MCFSSVYPGLRREETERHQETSARSGRNVSWTLRTDFRLGYLGPGESDGLNSMDSSRIADDEVAREEVSSRSGPYPSAQKIRDGNRNILRLRQNAERFHRRSF